MKKICLSICLILLSIMLVGCNQNDSLDEIYVALNNDDLILEMESYLKDDSKISFILVDKKTIDNDTYELYVNRLNGLNFKRAIIMIDHTYDEYYIAYMRENTFDYISRFINDFHFFFDDEYYESYDYQNIKVRGSGYKILNLPPLYRIADDYRNYDGFYVVNNLQIVGKGLHIYKDVKFPEDIKTIENYVFINNKYIEKVSFNSRLISIGIGVFKNCSNLKEVKLNIGIESIGAYAFYNCNKIEYIIIPENVKFINKKAFNYGNIYCSERSRPNDWDEEFATGDAKVYWKGEWEYNSEGIPQPIAE